MKGCVGRISLNVTFLGHAVANSKIRKRVALAARDARGACVIGGITVVNALRCVLRSTPLAPSTS